MKFEDTLCYSCFGCNQLENENFDGAVVCKNYIKADSEKTPEQIEEIKRKTLEKWINDKGVYI